MKAAVAALAACSSCLALAQQQDTTLKPETPAVLRVSASIEHSRLDKGNSPWDQQTVSFGRTAGRSDQQLSLSHYRRFGQDDSELAGELAAPLGETVTGWLRGSYSPSHRVIAHSTISGGLQWEFGKGWLLHTGLHHARYTANDADRLSLMVERYLGDFGVLAGVHRSRALGRTTAAWELRGSWYYAEGSSATLLYAAGDEATQTGPGTLAIADVRTVALYGRHRLDGPWSLTWGAHRVRQGTFHTRTGASAGVQYVF